MNSQQITTLLQNPFAIDELQSVSLENVVQEFPYFQSARALYLKGLFNQNSFKYNYSLKIAAAYTSDRSVLFDYITSNNFNTIDFDNKAISDEKILQIPVNNSVEVIPFKIEKSILDSISASKNETVEKSKDILEIGKPLEFSISEKHSFQEWLQLSKAMPIDRTVDTTIEIVSDNNKNKKADLIDKFIETNPKIAQMKHDTVVSNIIFEPSKADNSFLMTETLARVYLEQHKYQKAIQAYEILILKYPEKSSFFADRILDIKNLQQNNN